MPDYLKQLWTVKTRSGISMDDFRALAFSVTGKESTKDMSDIQRKTMVAVIQKLFPDTKKSKKRVETSQYTKKIFALPTPLQRQYIDTLVNKIRELGLYKLATVDAFSQKMFHKPSVKLSRKEASALTEALKSILLREK